MLNVLRLHLWLGSFLVLGTTATAQPADFTPQQRAVYETYRLSVEVQSRSGYIARPVGATGDSYDITSYYESSWVTRRGQRPVRETRFYEAAGRPEIARQIRREIGSDFVWAGVGLAMVGGAAGLAVVTEPDFVDGRPNLPLMGVLFLGIGGAYVAYDNLMDSSRKKTTPLLAAEVADQYNAVLIDEIRRAGPNAGAGGR